MSYPNSLTTCDSYQLCILHHPPPRNEIEYRKQKKEEALEGNEPKCIVKNTDRPQERKRQCEKGKLARIGQAQEAKERDIDRETERQREK